MFQLPRCSLCYCCKVGGLWAFACFFQSRQTRKASTVAGQLLGRFVDNRCQSSDNSSCVLFLWRHTSLERLRTLCQCLITSTYSIKNDSKLFFLSRFVLTAFRTSTLKPDTDVSMDLCLGLPCTVHTLLETRTDAAVRFG